MKHTAKTLLDEIYRKLGINKEVNENLCESLDHRQLFYVHLEICTITKHYMPYEYIRSLKLIDEWFENINRIESIKDTVHI